MAFERVFEYIGEFGPYQKRILHLVCLIALPTAIHTMLPVFINADTDHHCQIKYLDGMNCSRWDLTTNECEDAKLRLSIPDDDESTIFVDERKCMIRNISVDEFYPDLNETEIEQFDVVDCYAGWTYDTSQYKSTIVQEFDIVCGQSHRATTSWTVYFGGVLFGSFLFGNIADLFGRKPTFFIALGLQVVSEILIAFVPAFWLYSLCRFIVGMANMGVYLIGFVLVTEYVGPTKRTMAGSLFAIYWSLGYMFIAVLAFLFREWRKLIIVSTCVGVPLFFIFPFVPESVQWLNSKSKKEEAKEVLRKIATSNKTQIPEGVLDEILTEKQMVCE
ncbi:organic cation transporter protein-like [Anneissia japonica]|uniref:organic cation transporter protein-like n=1 Tax=Anneissia japonica TaxID=1529436 RepID=UPI0014256DAB|nr:organic cation transporter protein-like [Anneissia japonica]